MPLPSHAGYAIAFVLAGLASLPLRAQTPSAASPSYDISSIREMKPDSNQFQRVMMNPLHAARFRASGVSVQTLLSLAYDLPEDRIQGGPGWLNETLYVVDAKSDGPIDDRMRTMSDEQARSMRRLMLQHLLADRFDLKVHHDAVAGNVYALVVAKQGSKLHPAPAQQTNTEQAPTSNFSIRVSGNTMTFRQSPLHMLVDFLSQQMQSTLVDDTHLEGLYDFTLHFRQTRPGMANANQADSTEPSLPDALQEQLGLKVESRKGIIDQLVIDHVAKPTPN